MNNSIKKILFLGPKGTYSEIACEKFRSKTALQVVFEPVSTIAKIIEKIDKDKDLCAILPIENSIEGIVRGTLDGLFACVNNVKIWAQTEIQIQNCLISNSKKEDIKYIISHPQPLAQCQNYICANFNNIEIVNTTSTAAATSQLEQKGEGWASIGNEFCAKMYGVPILERNINDNKDNKTRFIFVSQNEHDFGVKSRTSLVFSTKQAPGALVEALNVFKKHNLNLIYIESRPSKRVLGEYNFFVDIDSDIENMQNALIELKDVTQNYKILGSYSVL